jgi:hypothetical protein
MTVALAVVLAASCLSIACGSPPDAAPGAERTTARGDDAKPLPAGDAAAPPSPTEAPPRQARPARDAQGAAATDGACALDDGVTPSLASLAALTEICPSRASERRVQRARLLLVATRGALSRVAPTLEDAELRALARLISGDAGQVTALAIEPLETARFVPIDDDVLARARGAWAILRSGETTVDDRTRAEAWLAEAHIAAIASLGVPRDEPAPPFVRLLAARALDHGRRFVTRWVQRRVTGTERAVTRIEREMEQLVAWLDAEPSFADPPEVAWALELARDHLRTGSARARRSKLRGVAASGEASRDPAWLGELERRLAAGMIPRALSRARAAMSSIPKDEREVAVLAMATVLRRWDVDPDRLSRGAGDPLRLVRDDLVDRLDLPVSEETAEASAVDDASPTALFPEAIVAPAPRRVVAPTWPNADGAAADLVAALREQTPRAPSPALELAPDLGPDLGARAESRAATDVLRAYEARRIASTRPDAIARALELAEEDTALAPWIPWLRGWWRAHVGRAPALSDAARRTMQDHASGDAMAAGDAMAGHAVNDGDEARRHRIKLAAASEEARRLRSRR